MQGLGSCRFELHRGGGGVVVIARRAGELAHGHLLSITLLANGEALLTTVIVLALLSLS
jgi:hypothetical protein